MTRMSQGIDSQLTAIRKDVGYVSKQADRIESLLERDYVTIDQYQLVVERVNNLQKVVWGFVGLVLMGFATAVVNFFLSNGNI